MNRVLLHQDIIPHYRKPILEIIGQYVDLTVVYSGETATSGNNYRLVKIPCYHIPKLGDYHGIDFCRLVKESDVIISILGRKSIDIDNAKFINKNVKIIKWGIGVSASYNTRYDSVPPSKKYISMMKQCDAVLFYSDYPKKKYADMGLPSESMFVANNTVSVKPMKMTDKKDILLFIGSLYAQKRVDLLIKSYIEADRIDNTTPPLYIIGDGDERPSLEKYVMQSKVQDKIIFCGQINDDDILSQYFSRAYACISPDQAGLSVLKSMGYGVPYITCKDAITGGEIFNIHNGIDGVLLEDLRELKNTILDISSHSEKYINMGLAAKKYYEENRTPQMMAGGFIDAINYVMRK